MNALLEMIMKAKPASSKGVYLKAICLSTTMGAGHEDRRPGHCERVR